MLTALRVRDIAVFAVDRERVLAEKDQERLERWLERAILTSSVRRGDRQAELHCSMKCSPTRRWCRQGCEDRPLKPSTRDAPCISFFGQDALAVYGGHGDAAKPAGPSTPPRSLAMSADEDRGAHPRRRRDVFERWLRQGDPRLVGAIR